MVPRLYKSSETAFTSEGLGRLTDARKCEVTEERNGQYELLLEYPVTGKLMPELTMGRIIWAIHDDSKTGQPFQIYEISRPLQGWVKVRAWHISYALNFVVCKPFSAASSLEAFEKIPQNIMGTAPYTFTFTTSIVKATTFTSDIPKSVRSLLGGSRGSIIDTYGGAFEFDKFEVKHYYRGNDNGVVIKYGKNLTKLDRELNRQNSYNSIVPYWTDGEEIVASSQVVVKPFQTQGNTVVMDASADFEEKPSQAQLRNWARAKLVASDTTKAKDTIKISFVELWQTEEYKHIANLERVRLCDTVTIDYEKGGVQVAAKCIKVVYDALLERYVSMELGEPQKTLSQQIQEDTEAAILPQVPNKTAMQGAIDRATELITGGFGGYIKYKYLQDGTPSEMLIMDTASEATATNIIRLNQNGLGFSTDGGATYANAWTIDGHLNADFITTGTLIASLIKTGLLQDQSGKNYWNLDTGQFVTKQGTIGNFVIDSTGLNYDNGKSIIDPSGIVYSDGATWRVTISDKMVFERYVNGAWVETARYGQGQQLDGEYASILAGGSLVARFSNDVQAGVQGCKNWIIGDTYVTGKLIANSNGPTRLWSGDLESYGTVSVPYGDYSFYVVEGRPSNGSWTTMIVHKGMLGNSPVNFQIADNIGYCGFTAYCVGSTAYFDYASKLNNGNITSIYGLI